MRAILASPSRGLRRGGALSTPYAGCAALSRCRAPRGGRPARAEPGRARWWCRARPGATVPSAMGRKGAAVRSWRWDRPFPESVSSRARRDRPLPRTAAEGMLPAKRLEREMRRVQAIILALTFTLAITATPSARAENVLRWASTTEALTFDPHAAYNAPTIAENHQVYEGLVDFDARYEVEPALATAWRLLDPLTWEFELRRG